MGTPSVRLIVMSTEPKQPQQFKCIGTLIHFSDDVKGSARRSGERAEALARYAKARQLPGFEAHEELDRLESQARRSAQPSLRVVSDTPSNVVPIQRVPEERIRFSSIVGMDDLKKTIRIKIIEPFVNSGMFQRFRKQAGGGILLYGPPGCGKTMIARAVANECNAEFISVGIADVLNMWIGESERNLAAIFEKARSQSPCMLFFDELGALAYSRSKANSEHTRTVVNEFLAQLDGVGKDNKSVLILAATNMPWDVDPAIKWPGRFSRQVFVPPPDVEARLKMLEIKLTGVPRESLDLAAIAKQTNHFSGADIDGLIELAKESALEDNLLNGPNEGSCGRTSRVRSRIFSRRRKIGCAPRAIWSSTRATTGPTRMWRRT